MDTIWNVAFGVDIDIQNNPNNEYFTKAEKVFENLANISSAAYISGNSLTVLTFFSSLSKF